MNTQTINDEGLGDFSSIPKEMQNARRWLVRAGKVPYYRTVTQGEELILQKTGVSWQP